MQDLSTKRHQHPLSGQLEYDTWAELLIQANHNSFGRHYTDPMFGPWVRRPLPQQKVISEVQPDNSPKEEEEEVAAFELSFRDFVSPKKAQPEAAVAEAAGMNLEKKGNQRRESRSSKSVGRTGLFHIKAFMPLVLAAVGGHRKVADGGVEKVAKVSPNTCLDKFDERSCGNGSSNHRGGSSRISGRKASCYLFLHRDRSRPIEI